MSMTASKPSDQRILHCWKEIADYLSAGVRTVQRWETEYALPVRRPRGTKRSAVLAFTSEIDAWLKTLPAIAQPAEQDEEMSGDAMVVNQHPGFRVEAAVCLAEV